MADVFAGQDFDVCRARFQTRLSMNCSKAGPRLDPSFAGSRDMVLRQSPFFRHRNCLVSERFSKLPAHPSLIMPSRCRRMFIGVRA